MTGSTALKSFIQEVSKALATQPTNPITVVYQTSASCVGVKAAIDPAANPMTPSLGPTTYYDAAGALRSCSLDATNPVTADVGISDVFYSTCYVDQPLTPPLPQNVAESYGPVQVMNFAVPQGSNQRSIGASVWRPRTTYSALEAARSQSRLGPIRRCFRYGLLRPARSR